MKKILSIILSIVMVFGLVTLPIYAESEITVYLSISQYGEFVTANDNKALVQRKITLSGGDSYNIDDVLRVGHAEFYDGDGYASSIGMYGSLSIDMLWGDESYNFGYYVNGASAWSLEDPVYDGDIVEAFIYENDWMNMEGYAMFESLTREAFLGEEVNVSLRYVSGYGGEETGYAPIYSPVSEAEITINGEESDIFTNEDGEASLTFDEIGEYIISAKKSKIIMVGEEEVETTAITAPLLAVSVGLGFDGEGREDDPYLLATSEDLVKLSSYCNTYGMNFEGTYFKMIEDIELPVDFEPIGALKEGESEAANGMNINAFSGVFDGGGNMVTIAEEGLPLFGYVREATIKNLDIYGERIAGYGLINNYVVDYGEEGSYLTPPAFTVEIENCTLKTGSQVLKSGFIGGYASGVNTIKIRDSLVEEGVVIGYEGDENNIGSFAGEFNGTLINCESYAMVYGNDFVGGLVGNKGQAMGDCEIYNSVFKGEIVATGECVGGIIGAGYGGAGWGYTANPQFPKVINCVVDSAIQGTDKVGGIMGAEPGALKTLENGVGYIQNNLFVGEIISSGDSVGGIIGFLKSINRFVVISNNYYMNADLGIGDIEIVETSESDEEIVLGAWYETTLDGGRYGRDDITTGEDNEKLTKKIEALDADVIEKLNRGLNSCGNFTLADGDVSIADGVTLISIKCPELTVTDGVNQKVGERNILSDMELILTYSDGSEETVSASRATKQYTVTNKFADKYYAASIVYQNHQLVFMLYIEKGSSGGGSATADEEIIEEMPEENKGKDIIIYEDVDKEDWFYEAVNYVTEKGIMNGMGEGFEPSTETTRAMIVTILYRLENEPDMRDAKWFEDVESGQWHSKAIVWAANNGIVSGYGNGHFGASDNVTREQLAPILYRYAKWKGIDTSVGEETNILSYEDFAEISEYAISALCWGAGSGLMQGQTNTTLNPKSSATRAELATILMRYLENVGK